MTCTNEKVANLYESYKEQTLDKIDRSISVWLKYKSDLDVTKSLLKLLPTKVKHDVMVPIGPKALVHGKIVHTNEFLVNLGDTWFCKRTASQTTEICDRKITTCNEMIQKLEKERELIINKFSVPAEQDAFGSGERPEIVEYVTEEENEEWKKQHKKRETEYCKQLAELRNKEKKPVTTEEELWNRLDELELQEELEDELNRMHTEVGSEDASSEENLDLEVENNEHLNENNFNENVKTENSDLPRSLSNCYKAKQRVSFDCDLNMSDDEPLKLEFKHSDCKPLCNNKNSCEIISPSDIYDRYLNNFSKSPISILRNNKNANQAQELERAHSMSVVDSEENDNDDDDDGDNDCEVNVKNVIKFSGITFNDVIQRSSSLNDKNLKVEEKGKKVSKFKALRLKNS